MSKTKRTKRQSRSIQHIFVFDEQEDMKALSLELIKICQEESSIQFMKDKFFQNAFQNNDENDDDFRQSEALFDRKSFCLNKLLIRQRNRMLWTRGVFNKRNS